MKSRVYLAGPMGGLTFEEANGWREYVSQQLFQGSNGSIRCFSPMRGLALTFDSTGLLASADKNPTAFTTNRVIMTRDYTDCIKSDVVFANFLGAPRLSIGTIMEVGFAYAHRVPVIAVVEDTDLHAGHPMMEEAFTYRVSSIDEGIECAFSFLLP